MEIYRDVGHTRHRNTGASLIPSFLGAVIRGLRTGLARLFSSEGFELICRRRSQQGALPTVTRLTEDL